MAADQVSASDEITMTLVRYYIENKKVNEAEAYLRQQLDENPKQPQSWRALGILRMQRNDLAEAQKALEKAAETSVGTEKGVNLYLLADLRSKSGDKEGARTALADATKVEGFEEVSEKASQDINDGGPLPALDLEKVKQKKEEREKAAQRPQYYLAGSASVKFGYDNNVLLLTDMPSEVIPASYYISPSLTEMYLRQLFGGNLSLMANGLLSLNASTEARPFNSGALTLGGDWSTNADVRTTHNRFNVGDSVSLAFTQTSGLSPFSVGNSFTPGWTYSFNSGDSLNLVVPVGYTVYPGVPITTDDDKRNGPVLGVTVSYRHAVGNYSLTENGAYSNQLSTGKNFKMSSYNLGVSALTTLSKETLMMISIGYGFSKYPYNKDARSDKKVSFVIDFSRPLSKSYPILGTVDYAVEKNYSNVAVSDYIKHNFSLKVQYDFK